MGIEVEENITIMVITILKIPVKKHLKRVKVSTIMVDQITTIEVVETIEVCKKELSKSNVQY